MISIIIPVLNEASFIGRLLTYLTENFSVDYISEIIVVDGGSTDATPAIVKNFDPINKHRITLAKTDTGRAKQMNFGAKKASGTILYFLHVDSLPPIGFDALIVNEVKKSNEAGCFRIQFDSSHWWLQLAGWFTQFNWRLCRGGDQSLFITRTLFNKLGGYDEDYLIYEDQILIHALYSRKQFVVIDKKLQTSARMYRKHGIFKLQYFYWRIYLKRWLGADADALYKYYKKWVA
ncbi:TIGR04283 family arsenosugar biosynthesis glycosyltransferase [Aestuariivivens sediminicola]|uniref:TIGR04283 family arsenosugar biosynthesis glycosyltransferase n=1 Tax=Aestuariivivens sediminicola TaxID=2913560 RepID=UPI001F58363C|nr:TIGR04283 family arsenosugar biosynthesis glycosyltransferase [Aestuariivivens sediminicola]